MKNLERRFLLVDVSVLPEVFLKVLKAKELLAAGASIVTINQATPENGAAQVAVSIRTGGMQGTLEDMLAQLKKQRTVVDIRRGV